MWESKTLPTLREMKNREESRGMDDAPYARRRDLATEAKDHEPDGVLEAMRLSCNQANQGIRRRKGGSGVGIPD